MYDINISTIEFVLRIANVVPANDQTLTVIMCGLNLSSYEDFAAEMYHITRQAYAGYNKDTGDWCKDLLKLAIDKQFA